jgi:hypothetical protein
MVKLLVQLPPETAGRDFNGLHRLKNPPLAVTD